MENGGTTILKQHQGSLYNALNVIYPGKNGNRGSNTAETKWKREWFQGLSKYHNKYWETVENQRKFLIEIATKNSISGTRDWKKISTALISRAGGKGLLKTYMGSLQLALKSLFPEDDWNPLSTQLHVEDKVRAIFWDKLLITNCRETRNLIHT